MKRKLSALADLKQDPRNANKGTKRGQVALDKSMLAYGAGRSVLADKNGVIIAGNKTVATAEKAGIKKIRVIETTGDELVVVQRTDLDLNKDRVAREMAFADNRAGELNLEWDPVQFTHDKLNGIDLSALFTPSELSKAGGFMHQELETATGVDDKLVFRVVVTCKDEAAQRKLVERLEKEGFQCQLLAS